MSRKKVKKSLLQQLSDLDDHLFLLRKHLLGLRDDQAYLKAIAAELRVLVCYSSRTEGLLWRMVERLKISDAVKLHLAGNVDTSHPLAAGLDFAFVPIQRAGFGPPELAPNYYSFKKVIKSCDAIFVAGKGLTHDYLIKAVAQQMGSAHEPDEIEIPLARMEQIFINGVQPYVSVLALDSELVLQVGERVIEEAEKQQEVKRKIRDPEYGDFSIALRFGLFKFLENKTIIVAMQSFVAEVEFVFSLTKTTLECSIHKSGKEIKNLVIDHPSSDWGIKKDSVIVISYSSKAKQIHAILNGKSQDNGIPCNIGWLHGKDLVPTYIPKIEDYPVYRQFISIYSRLLSSAEVNGLLELEIQEDGNWKSPDGSDLFLTKEDDDNDQTFPS